MKCIALYHVRFEDLGSFAAPLAPEEWRDADLVVVLGGPIGAGDTADYPWLAGEIAGLKQRLALERPTLGICLGAQLMAVALGGTIRRRTDASATPAIEIGWAPLDLARGPQLLDPLRGIPVLHWHGDNIVLPAAIGALAATPWTPVQAFAAGRHALALQFHGEFEAAALEEWLTGHAVELARAGVDLQALRADSARHGRELACAGAALLDQWLSNLD